MINKDLIEFIRELTKKDKKNLSQKSLKVAEETGELAKCILPFDNAPGTIHRFTDKRKVLEEVSDVILCAVSIAYELNCTDEEIEEMIYSKAVQWQGIISKEEQVDPNKIPYEIHVTVKMPEDVEIDSYKSDCALAGVKPLVLELEKDGESVMRDAQTSSTMIGNNYEAFMESERIAMYMSTLGYEVLRQKVETVPWHPAAPCDAHHKVLMPKNCYFEAHLSCVITKEEKELLGKVAKSSNAHISRNFFKKLGDGKFVNMITLRGYDGTYENFLLSLLKLKEKLKSENIDFEKEIVEFSIYDTKVSHDASWLLGEKINEKT